MDLQNLVIQPVPNARRNRGLEFPIHPVRGGLNAVREPISLTIITQHTSSNIDTLPSDCSYFSGKFTFRRSDRQLIQRHVPDLP